MTTIAATDLELEVAQALIEDGERFGRAQAQSAALSFSRREVGQPVQLSTARSLGEWLENEEILCPPRSVVPSLVVQGRVTLLSGREKIGKSTLVAGAVASVSAGKPVFGEATAWPLRVLWYALDEHATDTVRRFEKLGADSSQVFINDQPRTVDQLLAALKCDISAIPGVELVVVDTLSRVFAASGVDPNSSREVEPAISRLVDYFHRRDVACILLYHTGKGGREYRGSTAIGATVDDILTLRRRGQTEEDDFDDEISDDGRRLLAQDGRNLRGRLHLVCKNGLYGLYDHQEPARERILEALRHHGSAASRSALCKLAGGRKKDALRTIEELIADGSIRLSGRTLFLALERDLGDGSDVRGDQLVSAAPEPDVNARWMLGSGGFPQGGTDSEPNREPRAMLSQPSGSQSDLPHPRETGTVSREAATVRVLI